MKEYRAVTIATIDMIFVVLLGLSLRYLIPDYYQWYSEGFNSLMFLVGLFIFYFVITVLTIAIVQKIEEKEVNYIDS